MPVLSVVYVVSVWRGFVEHTAGGEGDASPHFQDMRYRGTRVVVPIFGVVNTQTCAFAAGPAHVGAEALGNAVYPVIDVPTLE